MSRVLRGLPQTLWLVVVWVALWGEISWANMLSGVTVAIGVRLVFPRAAPEPAGTMRPLWLLRFVVYFAYKVAQANLLVAWEVVTPGSRINQGIVAVPVRGGNDLLVTSVANSISLTPGTLTLEVGGQPRMLYVHVLHVRSMEQTRRDVLYLQYLLMRALAPGRTEDIAWLQRTLARDGESDTDSVPDTDLAPDAKPDTAPDPDSDPGSAP